MTAARDEVVVDVYSALAKLEQVSSPTPSADDTSWTACCPIHDDSNPSLSITEKADGSVLVNCFAGCPQADVRQALGLGPPSRSAGGVWMPDGIEHETTYEYADVDGRPRFEVLRGVKGGRKQFRQRVPDPSSGSGYRWSVKGLTDQQRATLYLAETVAGAIEAGETVYVVEGEKDALAALGHRVIATCNAGGAGKFTGRHAQQLKGADVVVVQDKDAPGRKHGAEVCRLLEGVADGVRLVEVAAGKDLADHLAAGHGLDDLVDVQPELASVTELPVPRDFDEWTDSGVSERFAASVRGRWSWVVGAGWHAWNGRVWEPRADEQLVEAVREFTKAEAVRAISSGDPAGVRQATARLGKRKIKDIAELVRGQLARDLADFDTDPDIMVVGNGVVDLRTSVLMPHDSGRLVTKSTTVDFQPGATHPDWDEVLCALPDGVPDWFQDRLGQATTGYVPDDDRLLALRGGGENGKSTLLGAMLDAMGDYAAIIPDKVLLGRPDDHSTEKMTLRGLRLAVQEETPEGRHLNIHQIKKILGAPKITARHVHKDNVTFAPVCAIAISTNYRLGVDEVDHGTWRRLAEVSFPFRYRKPHETLEGPKDRRGDPRLRDAVCREEQQCAVLAWLVEGARRWYENDRAMPPMPKRVVDDTEAWRRRSDHWLAFAEDNLVIEQGAAIWVDDVQREMSRWLAGRGHGKWSMNTFRARVESNPWLRQPGVFFSGRERRDPTTLSRPPAPELPLAAAPGQGQYLVGARFRTDADDDGSSPGGPPAPRSGPPAERGRPMPVITDLDEGSV